MLNNVNACLVACFTSLFVCLRFCICIRYWGFCCSLFYHVISVLVLNDVDKLSREAQHSLRRTMEKYSSYCRLILCCNSSSRVTEAIRSRCLNVRINGPTEEQVRREFDCVWNVLIFFFLVLGMNLSKLINGLEECNHKFCSQSRS